MNGVPGFIVEVESKNLSPITYLYDNSKKVLDPYKTFIGYFWQMTDRQPDGSFKKAHIREVRLYDEQKKLFFYGGEATFDVDDVSIKIRALRGPDNRSLLEEFKQYETWNSK